MTQTIKQSIQNINTASIASSAGAYKLLETRVFSTNIRTLDAWVKILDIYDTGAIGKTRKGVEKQPKGGYKLTQYHGWLREFGLVVKDINDSFKWTKLGSKLLKESKGDFSSFKSSFLDIILDQPKLLASMEQLSENLSKTYPKLSAYAIHQELIKSVPTLQTALKDDNMNEIPSMWIMMMVLNNDKIQEILEFDTISDIVNAVRSTHTDLTTALTLGGSRSYKTIINTIELVALFKDVWEDRDLNVSDKSTDKGGYTNNKPKYIRLEEVRIQTGLKHNHTCAHCKVEGFAMDNGTKYIESHHIIPLYTLPISQRFELDVMGNTIALCASCHRFAHFGDLSETDNLFNIMYNNLSQSLKDRFELEIYSDLRLKIYKKFHIT